MKRAAEEEYAYIVYVRNIAYDATKEELLEHMQCVGAVKSLRLVMDKYRTDRHKGHASCEYFTHEEMLSAVRNLNETTLRDRTLYVGVSANAVLPDVVPEEKKQESTLSAEEIAKGYQLVAAARKASEVDPTQFRELCLQNPLLTRHLLDLTILLGMAPELEEAVEKNKK